MSYKYKVKGARWIRMYTAAVRSPVYAAGIDAQNVADNMCTIPWTRARTDGPSTWPSHNSKALDENADNRHNYDAALWCADHSNEQHRAYANAACYRICLPDAAVGKTLQSVTVHAASDPYNSSGLRLAVHLSDTGEIPMSCATLRSGDAYVAGATPRTEATVEGSDGVSTLHWYATEDDVEIALTTPAALKRYLLVVVALENYAISRNNWLEGSGYIRNAIELTLGEAVDGWGDGIVDCIDEYHAGFSGVAVCTGGVVPPWEGASSPVLVANRCMDGSKASGAADGKPISYDDGAAGLHAAYADMVLGRSTMLPVESLPATRPGAGWSVRRKSVTLPVTSDHGMERAVPVWSISSSIFMMPFFVPRWMSVSMLRLSWTAPAPANGTVRIWLHRDNYDTDAPAEPMSSGDFFRAGLKPGAVVGGYDLVGETAAGTGEATICIEPLTETCATLLLSAYLDISQINLSSDAPQGVGALDAGQSAGDMGFATLLVPEIILT